VEGYLEDVIPLASAKQANKEGAVQAAVSVFSAGERVMVDREVALTFKDTPRPRQGSSRRSPRRTSTP
jgi:hypothetical protein